MSDWQTNLPPWGLVDGASPRAAPCPWSGRPSRTTFTAHQCSERFALEIFDTSTRRKAAEIRDRHKHVRLPYNKYLLRAACELDVHSRLRILCRDATAPRPLTLSLASGSASTRDRGSCSCFFVTSALVLVNPDARASCHQHHRPRVPCSYPCI